MPPYRRRKNQDKHYHETGNGRIPPPPPPPQFYEALIQFMADNFRQFTEAIAHVPPPNN
jgi:hypothetical protein